MKLADHPQSIGSLFNLYFCRPSVREAAGEETFTLLTIPDQECLLELIKVVTVAT